MVLAVQCLSMTSLPTRRWPSRSQESFGLESVLYLEEWKRYRYLSSGLRFICLYLPPDKTWHKVNDQKVGMEWVLRGGKVGTDTSPGLDICHCLAADRTWHRVNDPTVGLEWGLKLGGTGRERVKARALLVISSFSSMWARWALLDMDSNVNPGTDAWL